MRSLKKARLFAAFLSCALVLSPLKAIADDIDIFVGSSGGSAANPNILIVLDNTSNWARQSQQWPGGLQQGQSEANAIKTVLSSLSSDVNLGLLEFVTGGNANDDGGFVRYAISPMTTSNQSAFSTILTTIYNNVTSPNEKRNSNTPYGDLMFDVYNYFAGANVSLDGSNASRNLNPPNPGADSNGYTSNYSTFKAPLSAANSCAKNYVIFIGNPNASGPATDSTANTAALGALGASTTQLPLPNFTTTTQPVPTNLGYTSQCYSSAASCSTSDYTAQCASYDSCTCSASSATSALPTCSSGQRYSVVGTANSTSTVSSNSVVSNGAYTGTTSACVSNAPSASCPASSTSSTVVGNQTTTTTTSWASCSYTAVTPNTCSPSSKNNYQLNGNKTVTTTVTQSTSTPATLGNTFQCYASSAACTTSDYATACAGYNGGCACNSSSTTTTGSCPSGSRFQVQGNTNTTVVTPTGTSSPPPSTLNADEWTQFMYQTGVSVASVGTRNVTTYAIDVFNAQQNATQTGLLMSMAKAGGGKYFSATNEAAIVSALKTILAEIQSVNSTFASASLPVNATNRSQNENQVFIGMFRPDPNANPRWPGNLKRYQLINTATGVDLGDSTGASAVNSQTGFVNDCAISYWTTDSMITDSAGAQIGYWKNVTSNPSPAGKCTTTSADKFSDTPDGPIVEKGAVAEVLRKGNNPPTTTTTPTWAVNRTVYTLSGSTLASFSASSSGLTQSLVDFILGKDTNDENNNANLTETRPSIHGDVVHSRPLPVNYGGSTGVTVYYGANDGMLRAVDANTGKEKWAFVAPEFFTRLARLQSNSPLISYPSMAAGVTPTPTPKDYFFDGSMGLYQNADNSKIWLYSTMRRGGRMIYAFDVTSSTIPTFKWKAGCPNLTDNSGCTTGMSGIGQTWSTPLVAFVKNYSTTTPVIIIGGGYDSCEDGNSATPSCASPTGNQIFVLNADTGDIIKTLATTRSVVGDISLVDSDFDGMVDYAYAADTGGNIYRADLTGSSGSWSIAKVGHTSGAGRKFLYGPAVLPVGSKVFLAIGSGDREHPLESHYPFSSPVTNRFYVYLDNLAASTDINLDDSTLLANYTSATSCSSTQITPSSTLKGWFMDLTAGTGEQTVTSALIVAGQVVFSTNRPIPASAGTCSTSLGEARGYLVNLFNASGGIGAGASCGGSRSVPYAGGGLPPSPVMGTVPINGIQTTIVIGAPPASGGSATPISPSQPNLVVKAKRKKVYQYIKGVDNQ